MKQRREKIFFGTKEIFVTGDVKYRIVGGFGHLSSFDKNILAPKLLKKLNTADSRIPIRKWLDCNYAVENFIYIVDFHNYVLGKKFLGKNLGGKLDVDDLNLDQENNYIIEKEENKRRLSTDTDEESINGTLVFDDLNAQDSGSASEIPESVFD